VRLTPLEIRKQTFPRRRFGGVDAEEVQDFLNLAASELEELVRSNALLKERLEGANQQITEFKTMEETLRRTLIRAEEMSAESQDNARRECELIIKQGELRAERILEDARARLRVLKEEIDELQKKKEVYLQRFRSLIDMQMELLEHHRDDFDEISLVADAAQKAEERHARPVTVPDDDGFLRSRQADGESNGGHDRSGPLAPSDESFLEFGADDDV